MLTTPSATPFPGQNAVDSFPRSPRQWPDWTREPLLHFIFLGSLLFGADHLLISHANDPHTIVVGAAVDDDAKQIFKTTRGRNPNPAELSALRRVWLDNEVLYREGLALQVDKGDSAIRDRVIFKALSIIDANIKLPPIDDGQLRSWFDNHRAKYDEPPRYDFQEAALSGANSEAVVKSFVNELNAGTPGDAKAGLRVFKGRPLSNLIDSYGDEFAVELQRARIGEWRAMHTRDGWRAIQLNAITPAKPADYESLRGAVMQDWTDATASEQRTAAVRALDRKYKIRYETGSP